MSVKSEVLVDVYYFDKDGTRVWDGQARLLRTGKSPGKWYRLDYVKRNPKSTFGPQ